MGVWFYPEGVSNIQLLKTSRRNLFLSMKVMPFIDLKCNRVTDKVLVFAIKVRAIRLEC